MVSRSRTLQPLVGAFLDEPPVLLLGGWPTPNLVHYLLCCGDLDNLLSPNKLNNFGGDFVSSLVRCKLVRPCHCIDIEQECSICLAITSSGARVTRGLLPAVVEYVVFSNRLAFW